MILCSEIETKNNEHSSYGTGFRALVNQRLIYKDKFRDHRLLQEVELVDFIIHTSKVLMRQGSYTCLHI